MIGHCYICGKPKPDLGDELYHKACVDKLLQHRSVDEIIEDLDNKEK